MTQDQLTVLRAVYQLLDEGVWDYYAKWAEPAVPITNNLRTLIASIEKSEPVYFCDYGSHDGWGKVTAAQAEGLKACGYTVELYYTHAQPKSELAGVTSVY